MELLKVLREVEVLSINGPVDISIEDISYDSRNIKKGSMFICIRGNTVDGHDYIDEGIKKRGKGNFNRSKGRVQERCNLYKGI